MMRLLIIVLTVASFFLTGPAYSAEKSLLRRRAESCLLALGLVGGIAGRIEANRATRAAEPVKRENDTFVEVAGHALGPAMVGLHILARSSTHSLADSTIVAFRQDYGFLLSYTAMFLALRKARYKFFDIRFDDFEEASQAAMKSNPGRVLIVSSVPPKNEMNGFPEFYAKKRYAQGNVDSRSVQNLSSLIALLDSMEKEIASGSLTPYDRVEIFMHGEPNVIYFGDGSSVAVQGLRDALKGRKFAITNSNADVRFISCSLAGGEANRKYDLMTELGSALLPQGGHVLGSPKNILVADGLWSWEGWGGSAVPAMQYLLGIQGIASAIQIAPSLYRNYKESTKQIIVREIPPEAPRE